MVRFVSFFVAVMVWATTSASALADAENGPPVLSVSGNRVISHNAPHFAINVDDAFLYLGRTDFILFGAADVQRFYFAVGNEERALTRLLVVQFEQYRDTNEYTYNGRRDEGHWIDIGPLDFRTHATVRDAGGIVERWAGRGLEYEFQHGFLSTYSLDVPGPQLMRTFTHILPGERAEIIVLYYELLGEADLDLDALNAADWGLTLDDEALTGRSPVYFPHDIVTGNAEDGSVAARLQAFWRRGAGAFSVSAH